LSSPTQSRSGAPRNNRNNRSRNRSGSTPNGGSATAYSTSTDGRTTSQPDSSMFSADAFATGRQARPAGSGGQRPARVRTEQPSRSTQRNQPDQARPAQPSDSGPRRSGRSSRPAGPAARPAPAPAPALLTTLAPTIVAPLAADATPGDSLGFAELGVPAALIPPLRALGAISPFPIQTATLPATLAGKDVLGRGRTGSGKTIAFAIPLVARLTGGRRTPHRPRGLVLLPTRELALQVARTIEPLAKAAGLRTTVIFGGVGQNPQVTALRSGVDIVIACPGRLEDLIGQGFCSLADVQITVLDEADHMADLGFLPAVRRLLRATPRNGQRLLFSATLDNGISVLVNDFLTDPAVHAVDGENSPVVEMAHHVFAVAAADRGQVVRELATGDGRRLLFTRTKHGAKKLAATLSKNGIPAVDLHGNLSQNARERNLAAFSSGAAKVLVATDIAARGIHVDDIELVVHVDPPIEHKAYTHRSGRTARAGAGGTVVTLMTPDQTADVRKMMKQAGITAATTSVVPGHGAIAALGVPAG